MPKKHCPHCGLDKDTSEFTKDVSRKDGLVYFCRKCRNIYEIQYRKTHPKEYTAEKKEYNKKYHKDNYIKNSEFIRAKVKEYQKENSEFIKKRKKQYYEKHAEAIKKYKQEYYSKHPLANGECTKRWSDLHREHISEYRKSHRQS